MLVHFQFICLDTFDVGRIVQQPCTLHSITDDQIDNIIMPTVRSAQSLRAAGLLLHTKPNRELTNKKLRKAYIIITHIINYHYIYYVTIAMQNEFNALHTKASWLQYERFNMSLKAYKQPATQKQTESKLMSKSIKKEMSQKSDKQSSNMCRRYGAFYYGNDLWKRHVCSLEWKTDGQSGENKDG